MNQEDPAARLGNPGRSGPGGSQGHHLKGSLPVSACAAGYFRGDAACGRAVLMLSRTARPLRRARALRTLADDDWHRACLHEAMDGPHSADAPPPPSVALADGARMLWVLTEAEARRATRGSTWHSPWYQSRLDDDARHGELHEAVSELFADYEAGAPRRPLVPQMCDIWYGMADGQAVEAPWCHGQQLPWWTR